LTTLNHLLQQARAIGVERLDAQLLAAHALQRSRSWVIAHAEEVLTIEPAALVNALLQRRAAGEPLAYIVGEREFAGLRLQVTPAVLIPRADTETLVDWALELLRKVSHPWVLDLGTGSGAVALALKHRRADAHVHASDVSAAALAVARANGERLGLHVHWHLGAWWDALSPLPPAWQFDLVASNPPYVAPGDPHLAALTHEPLNALVPEGDAGSGLADIERIAAPAPMKLRPGGWLLLEHGAQQGEAVRACLAGVGLTAVSTRRDLAGLERVTGGRQP
jgi:release factor glutamine methyltransferase